MRFGSSINDVICFSYLFDPLSTPMSPLFFYYAPSIHPHFSTNPPPYLKKYCDIIYGRSFWGMRMCLVSCKSLGNTYFQVSLSKIETRQYKRKSTSLTKKFSNFSCTFLNPNNYSRFESQLFQFIWFEWEASGNKLEKHSVTKHCSDLSLFE